MALLEKLAIVHLCSFENFIYSRGGSYICDKNRRPLTARAVSIYYMCSSGCDLWSVKVTSYRPQRSCGKVIFSQACVKNSVPGGGGMHGRGGMHGGRRGHV